MPTASRRMHYRYGEYLALEAESPIRHEYLDGEIYAMAGGTPDHAALSLTVLSLVRSQLAVGCRAFTSDLRVRIVATGLTTYPDGAVVCGVTRRADDDGIAVINPVLLIEVTSNSSEDYDRGEKLRHYQTIPTVREILIVSHRKPHLTVHRRDDANRWTAFEAGSGQTLSLTSTGGSVAVDDVYRDGLEDAANEPSDAVR